MLSPDLIKAYRAARFPAESGRYTRPAALALPFARSALARYADARDARHAATAAVAEARAIDARRYAPALVAAQEKAAKAQRAVDSAYREAFCARPVKGPDASLNRPFAIGGPRGPSVQWCEAPAMRFAGLAEGLARLDHSGWFTSPEGDNGELARGVVYQLAPAKGGRARYVPGIADPCNADKAGRGPAMLAMGDMITADGPEEWQAEEAARDAARRADRLAEIYAEAERDWQEAYSEGQAAREKAQLARQEGQAWVAALRGLRAAFAGRRVAGLVGLSPDDMRAAIRAAVALARNCRESYLASREEAREARAEGGGEAWAEGYAEGAI